MKTRVLRLRSFTWPIAVYEVDPRATEIIVTIYNETRRTIPFQPQSLKVASHLISFDVLSQLRYNPASIVERGDTLNLEARQIFDDPEPEPTEPVESDFTPFVVDESAAEDFRNLLLRAQEWSKEQPRRGVDILSKMYYYVRRVHSQSREMVRALRTLKIQPVTDMTPTNPSAPSGRPEIPEVSVPPTLSGALPLGGQKSGASVQTPAPSSAATSAPTNPPAPQPQPSTPPPTHAQPAPPAPPPTPSPTPRPPAPTPSAAPSAAVTGTQPLTTEDRLRKLEERMEKAATQDEVRKVAQDLQKFQGEFKDTLGAVEKRIVEGIGAKLEEKLGKGPATPPSLPPVLPSGASGGSGSNPPAGPIVINVPPQPAVQHNGGLNGNLVAVIVAVILFLIAALFVAGWIWVVRETPAAVTIPLDPNRRAGTDGGGSQGGGQPPPAHAATSQPSLLQRVYVDLPPEPKADSEKPKVEKPVVADEPKKPVPTAPVVQAPPAQPCQPVVVVVPSPQPVYAQPAPMPQPVPMPMPSMPVGYGYDPYCYERLDAVWQTQFTLPMPVLNVNIPRHRTSGGYTTHVEPRHVPVQPCYQQYRPAFAPVKTPACAVFRVYP